MEFESVTFNAVAEMFRIEINQLKGYSQTLERLLRSEFEDFERKTEKTANQLSEDQREEFYDYLSDEHSGLSDLYPNTLRAPVFVFSYSRLEYFMLRLCEYIKAKNKYKLGVADLHGKGIWSAYAYLTKVAELECFLGSKQWSEIRFLNGIRNVVVHAKGRIDKSKPGPLNLYTHMKNWKSLTLDTNDHLRFSATFNKDVFNRFDKFRKEMGHAIPS